MVNKVILIGNLGRDPEVRYLEGNVAVARFSVATNENYKDKKGEWQTATEWHDVVVWRSLAERAEKQLKKGSQVFVEGKLTHRKYQDKEGNDRYVTEGSSIVRMPNQVARMKTFIRRILPMIHPHHQVPVANNKPMMISHSDHLISLT